MGVQIDKPIVNLRNILDGIFKPKWFELPKRKWFSNLVINGTFDTDVNWTKGTNWRIDDTDSNVADQSVATASDLTQTVNTIIGTKYSIVFTTTSRTVGTLTLNMDLVTVGSTATNETVTLIFTATSSTHVITFAADGTWDGSLDNVSIREVYELEESANVQSVFDNGSLLKEGGSDDYTIESNGFIKSINFNVDPGLENNVAVDYWIKL